MPITPARQAMRPAAHAPHRPPARPAATAHPAGAHGQQVTHRPVQQPLSRFTTPRRAQLQVHITSLDTTSTDHESTTNTLITPQDIEETVDLVVEHAAAELDLDCTSTHRDSSSEQASNEHDPAAGRSQAHPPNAHGPATTESGRGVGGAPDRR